MIDEPERLKYFRAAAEVGTTGMKETLAYIDALRAYVVALQAKAQAWENFVSLQTGSVQEMARKALEADGLQADACRYRWLREQNTVPYGIDSRGEVQNVIVFWDDPVGLDAAIDAALHAPTGKRK